MKDKPLVSVIVGIYKGEKYISDCVESIIEQDYMNLEIILVNDGSPDECGRIIDEYARKDNRIVVVHQTNSGVSKSRNNALELATGDYLCIVDQDDVLAKNYVSYFLELINKYDAEIAYTPQPNKFFGKLRETKKQNDNIELISGEEAVCRMLYHKIVIAPWNKMIDLKLIRDNQIKFNTEFFCGEGFAFSIECFQAANRIAVGQRKVYNYRVGDPESGASKFRLSTIHSSINAQQYIKDKLINKSPNILKAWNFSNWHTYCDCLNIMVGCGVTKKFDEEYKKLKNVCKSQALCALCAPISPQQKLRGILFKINPFIASKIINKFRVRKFSKN